MYAKVCGVCHQTFLNFTAALIRNQKRAASFFPPIPLLADLYILFYSQLLPGVTAAAAEKLTQVDLRQQSHAIKFVYLSCYCMCRLRTVFDQINLRLAMKVKRSLYSLSQSSVLWYVTIDSTLLKVRFTRTKSDPCAYTHSHGDDFKF